ncbi:MAG TPA: asparagine synthase (glutamine-hydrolyzing) [Bacteroidia bacterium]|nr:asparagine synthase (glutamine-hydrolyzing) [Bacteroidia bacterium]
MCGISGIFTQGTPVPEESVRVFDQALAHRGPDGTGHWYNAEHTVLLHHRRLSILDLKASAAQPMIDSSNRYIIVYNGEIFNFIELRKELVAKGHSFQTESDTEVILTSYREWGESMLDKFNGMWALAIYDQLEQTLFCARDRYGIKPFYYIHNPDSFAFASEVQALQKFLGKDARPDHAVLSNLSLAGFQHHGTARTYIEQVQSLPGGYSIHYSARGLEINKWYSLKSTEVPSDLQRQSEKLLDLLTDSCQLRLRSDVSVATCLSGGLDSGSITALLKSSHPDSLHRFGHYTHKSFLASFPGAVIDERKEAEQLASIIGNELKILDILTPAAEDIESSLRACDGPMHAFAFYPIWKLYGFIRQNGIKVTLDGQGPDEMLGGYRPIQAGLLAAVQLRNVKWLKDIFDTYSAQGESEQFSSKAYAKDAVKFVAKAFIKNAMKGKLLNSMQDTIPMNLDPVRNDEPFDNALDNYLYRSFFYNPLPAILNQFDRCSMAHGVECRMPFMDYRIVEFLFSLPPTSKVSGGYTKRVLRDAMQGILPDSTRLNKRKIGFNAPVVEWFQGPLKEFMLDIMHTETFQKNPYFDGKVILNDYQKFLIDPNPQFDQAFRFWPSVHIAWWLNTIK